MSRSRRSAGPLGRLAIAAVIAGLAIGVTACEAGNNAPTLQFHPQSAGLDVTVHGVQIINAFVLGAPVGSTLAAGQSAGLFMALYNQGSRDQLVRVSAPGVAKSALLPRGAIALPSQQAVYLSGPKPVIELTGLLHPLASGGSVHVTLDFMNAGSVTLNVPVQPQAYEFGTFSPAPSPSPSPAKRGASGTPSGTPSSAPATSSASPSPSS